MPNTRSLKEISDERIAFIARESDRFTAALNVVADELRDRSINLLTNFDPANAAKAKALVTLQRELTAQLNRLNYDGAVRSFIQNYDASQIFALETLEALSIPPVKLAPLDRNALQALKAHDYTFMIGVGEDTVQAVATGVVQNTLMGTPRSQIIANIAGTLDTKLRGQGVTYADTALVSYDRRASMAQWQKAGITNFLYRGPRDIKNRVFCDHHVGQVYSLEQIKALDLELAKYSAKPLLPCLYFGGGWNCRHVWTPSQEFTAPPRPDKSSPPTPITHAQRLAQAKRPGDLISPVHDETGKQIGFRVSGSDSVYSSEEYATKVARRILFAARPDLAPKPAGERTRAAGKVPKPPPVPVGPGGEAFVPGPEIRRQLAAHIATLDAQLTEARALRDQLSQTYRDAVGIDARQAAFDALGEQGKVTGALTRKRLENGRSILYAAKPAKVKTRNTYKYDPDKKVEIDAGVEGFKRIVGAGHALDGLEVKFKFDPAIHSKLRSFYDVNVPGEVMLNGYNINARTTVHEMGHWYEDFDEIGRGKIREFLKKRTTRPDGTREAPELLADVTGIEAYRADLEATRKDRFDNPYTGKVYESPPRWYLRGRDADGVYATEVMSMGLEAMYASPLNFAKEDPEFFDLIWSVLRAPRP